MDSKPCSWCVPKSHLGFIADSNGFFSDFDCDLSYGIGVCGGCGGLGIQVEGEDFKARANRIMQIRFEYCPTDELPEPPTCVRLQALKNLKREVTEHYALFGEGRVCYAKFLLDTELNRLILAHEKIITIELEAYTNMQPSSFVSNPELSRQALLASVRGDLDEAETMHRSLISQSTSSVDWHDAGTFFLMHRRDAEQALQHYRKSCECEPKKALHFLQTARLLILLERNDEVLPFLREAIKCEDFENQDAETKEQITQLVSI